MYTHTNWQNGIYQMCNARWLIHNCPGLGNVNVTGFFGQKERRAGYVHRSRPWTEWLTLGIAPIDFLKNSSIHFRNSIMHLINISWGYLAYYQQCLLQLTC